MNNVIIIGAGVGGLTTAIRLAHAGHRVTVFEQNQTVGGKMNEVRADGFRWDTGPSVITMRHVLEDLFADVGCKLEDYLTLLPVDPLTRYFYRDGTVLDASRDLSYMAQQIGALNERDVEGYLNYLAYAARLHRITGPAFIYDDPPTLKSLRKATPTDLLNVDGLRTMDRAIRGFVRSPHLRQLLGRFATYVGGSPYLAPATLNVIAHVELTGGVWYPQGGIYAIAEALSRLARELGVDIQTPRGVRNIAVRDKTATGVYTTDGDYHPAAQVVANVDVTTVQRHLLPAELTSSRKKMAEVQTSCSGFVLLLGVNKQFPQLAHHNIFFSNDYPKEFRQIFTEGCPPDEPTIYVAITSKTDPDHAPDGCENWFVLVNAPPVGDKFDWSCQASVYRQRILDQLADHHGVDIRPHIISEQMLTPLDLAQQSGAWQGALYGLSPNSRWTAFQRPHNRSRQVKRLYFVGGTTHPGGGVPMVMLSGKVVSRMINQP